MTKKPVNEDTIRWLHDKLERFEFHENELLIHRTNTFATILAALIAAEVVVWIYYSSWSATSIVLRVVVPIGGSALSALYIPVIRRTAHAQRAWRAAAQVLENHLTLAELPESITPQSAFDSMRAIPGMEFLDASNIRTIDIAKPVTMYQSIFKSRGVRRSVDVSSPTTGAKWMPVLSLAVWLLIEAVTLAVSIAVVSPNARWVAPGWVIGPVAAGLAACLAAFYLLRHTEP